MASISSTRKRSATSPPLAPAQSQAKISKYFERKTQRGLSSKIDQSLNTTPAEPQEETTSAITSLEGAPPPTSPDTPSNPKTLTLTYHTGDIFAAPPESLLIHACNTQGSWGAGIAAAFRTRYPQAYKRYRDYCLSSHSPTSNPVRTGTCLLIPPCETDPKKEQHWIGCVFTSAKYGKAKDKPGVILANTGPAMGELLEKFKEDGGDGKKVRMCKINSARFGVEWERTVAVLEGIEVEPGWAENVEVWSIG
jgi:ADP-ribose 1''-phosphate phosphatase